MNFENKIEILKSILGEFFKDQFYKDGVLNLRKTLLIDTSLKEHWQEIIKIILLRELPLNHALDIVYEYANVPLHVDSENEAYNWLTLMIINVGINQNENILDYATFLDPSNSKPFDYSN